MAASGLRPCGESRAQDSYRRRESKLLLPALALAFAALALGCGGTGEVETTEVSATGDSQRPAANPLRNAYFGDLHVHTRYSMDAYIFNVRADADAAYRFAKGEPLEHVSGHTMRLGVPFDFQAVTDHGILNIDEINISNSNQSPPPGTVAIHVRDLISTRLAG